MSFIAIGYKAEIGRLKEAVELLHEQQWELAKELFFSLCNSIWEGDGFSPHKQNDNYRDSPTAKAIKVFEESMKSPKRSITDIDCGINVFISPDGNWFYVHLFGLHAPRDWTTPEWLKDFSYWDNCDKPEEISSEEWLKRREEWMSSGASGFSKSVLTHKTVGSTSQLYMLERAWIEEVYKPKIAESQASK